MKKLNKVSPYSDQYLVWNNALEQYELKFDYVNSDSANTFGDSEVLRRRLKINSDLVYGFIFKHCYSANLPYVKRLINNTEEGRKFILSVLTTQMRVDLENGANDLVLTPAINVATGQILPREVIRRNEVGIETEDKILNYNNCYFGFNIMVACAYPMQIRSFIW